MPAQIHRLFFALRPDAALQNAIVRVAQELRVDGRVHGRWLKPEKLHVTVQFLGDFSITAQVIAQARAGAGNVRCAPFDFVLDRADTFPRRFNPPCVLRCASESDADLLAFALNLGEALRHAGLAEHLQARAYVPHLTIAYADDALHAPVEITPIVWHARDFCLMDSLVGSGAHAEIARWPLRA